LDDRRFLVTMARAAEEAGATVISQVRYRFGSESPPGFTAIVVLDESHVSAHSYADTGRVALDVFTCGDTDPRAVWQRIRSELGLEHCTVREYQRFVVPETVTADVEEARSAWDPSAPRSYHDEPATA
jgi:S-adenosylmethionine decarboxylase